MITSILTGDAIRISPSSYGTFVDCPLKWWTNKVAGHPTPTSPSQQLGTDVHTDLEIYLRDGIKPDESTHVGRIATAGLPYLPEPKTYAVELVVETTCGPLPFKGIVDAWKDDHIIDHKTTKDFRWAMSSFQLAHSPQPLSYIAALIKIGKITEKENYRVSFIYYRTTGMAFASLVDAKPSHKDVMRNWAEMESAAQSMAVYARQKNPAKIPANTNACKKYGGCPFKDTCPKLNTKPNNEANMNERQQKLQAFLSGKEVAISPPDSPPTKTPTDAQRKDALDFARAASKNTGKELDNKTLLAITKRFQLPESESVWLKGEVESSEVVVSKTKSKPKPKSKSKPSKKPQNDNGTLWIYVDCIPDTGVDTTLDKWVFPFEQEVTDNSAKFNEGEIVGHYNAIPFGKGKSEVLRGMTKDLLQGRKFDSIYVSTRHTMAGLAISLLCNLPKAMVIRGVR